MLHTGWFSLGGVKVQYIWDNLKKKSCLYEDFKYIKKIIENQNFLKAKNVYLGVSGLIHKMEFQHDILL